MRSARGAGRSGLLAAALLALVLPGPALAGAARRTAAAKVTVTFTDRALRVSPTTPSSGPTTFVVVNRGKRVHVLQVKGPGIKGRRTGKVPAGKSARLTVTLRPGAYVLSDPVGLGEYNVMFLDVIPGASVGAKGDASVVAPPVELPPMCGMYYTP
ncbi:MAG TPA: hypothetical protein VFB42_06280 [Gaiellaceae bacterium]|nr:hypothetical protein [Gaiellaceae bacterium]